MKENFIETANNSRGQNYKMYNKIRAVNGVVQ